MKRLFSHAFSGLLFSALFGSMAAAHGGQLASLAIIDQQTGAPLKIWRHRGQNYVVGQPGQRYALQINNKTQGRLLAVAAVDGINVITGATASAQQSGYVLSPWQGMDVAGWRKNMQEVAAFYFTQLSDSYAARTERGDQAGVIGVALYREREAPVILYSPSAPATGMPKREAAKRAPGAADAGADRAAEALAAPQVEQKLGTGHGERIDSASTTTDFRRASTSPAEVLTIYYDSYANLRARGVIPQHYRPQPARPVPFPGNEGFVPDPS